MKKSKQNNSSLGQRAKERTNGSSKKARVALEAEEVGAVLRACRKYRATIPIYLQSVQPELHAVDEVIRKLSRE